MSVDTSSAVGFGVVYSYLLSKQFLSNNHLILFHENLVYHFYDLQVGSIERSFTYYVVFRYINIT